MSKLTREIFDKIKNYKTEFPDDVATYNEFKNIIFRKSRNLRNVEYTFGFLDIEASFYQTPSGVWVLCDFLAYPAEENEPVTAKDDVYQKVMAHAANEAERLGEPKEMTISLRLP